MQRPWRARLVGGGLLALAGIVMFEVPSAYAIVRGAPGWLALAIGLLVFPVLPLTWHIVRQRQRRAAPASARPSNTTGWERFAFRQIVVGVLVIGALIALDRSRVWRAVRHHALWMIPTTVGPLEPESKLLDRVPASAETIIWLRDTDDAHAMVSQVAPTSFGSRELVIAFDGSQAMVLETGDGGLIELIEPLYGRFAIGAPAAKVEKLPGGIRMWSTGGWKPSTGRATGLIELMRRAPDTAFLVAAGRPRSVKADEIASGVGWIAADRGELEAVAEVTAKSPVAAVKLLAEAKRSLAKERAAKPAAFACGSASDGSLGFTAYGSIVVTRVRIPIDQIRPLFVCLDR
jgi:hypothetical protein